MAHFHLHPGGKRISHDPAQRNVIAVKGHSVIIGLWGHKDGAGRELDIVEETDALMIPQPLRIDGNSRLYTLTVKPSVRAKGKPVQVKILANTSDWQTWDTAIFSFDCSAQKSGGDLSVTPATARVYGGPQDNIWRRADLKPIETVEPSSLSFDIVSKPPRFATRAGGAARFALFAAKVNGIERGYIVLAPASGAVSRVLLMITHSFGQNTGYYAGKGWSNPLSRPLIDDIMARFVNDRWGPQLMAARSDTAMIMPVRAEPVGGSELGPFGMVNGVAAAVVKGICAESGFKPGGFEIATYSSGIYDTNRLLGVSGLSFAAGYNQDPAGGHGLGGAIGVRKQFISGMTTHGQPRPGFTLLPLSWFANHGSFGDARTNPMWLHDVLHPYTTLFLGLMR